MAPTTFRSWGSLPLENEPARIATAEEVRLAQIEKNQAAIRLIRSWVDDGDEQEQTETLEYLKTALDEDRVGQRKLFP